MGRFMSRRVVILGGLAITIIAAGTSYASNSAKQHTGQITAVGEPSREVEQDLGALAQEATFEASLHTVPLDEAGQQSVINQQSVVNQRTTVVTSCGSVSVGGSTSSVSVTQSSIANRVNGISQTVSTIDTEIASGVLTEREAALKISEQLEKIAGIKKALANSPACGESQKLCQDALEKCAQICEKHNIDPKSLDCLLDDAEAIASRADGMFE